MSTATGPETAEDADRRNLRRNHVYKGGKILTGVQRAIVDCVVRNWSHSGAKLRIGESSLVPNEFLLYIPVDLACYRVQVRHREGLDIGVEILGPVDKPEWLHI